MQISLARRVDPLAKLLWLLAVSISGSLLVRWEELLGVTGIVCASFALCGRDELAKARRYWWVIVFIPSLLMAYHMALLPLASSGGWNPARITASGTIYSLKILNSVLALVFLLISTDIRQLVDRFTVVGMPAGAAFTIYLMIRFVEIARSDARYIREALLIRAGGRRWSLAYSSLLLRRYAATLVLLGMLRAEQTAMAMDLRGFSASGNRTYLSHSAWPIISWLFPLTYCASVMLLWMVV